MAQSLPEKPAIQSGRRTFFIALICLIGALLLFFAPSFRPEKVLFANDGPLGANISEFVQPPQSMLGIWIDLNWIGNAGGTYVPSFTFFLFYLLKPLYFAKLYGPLTLLFLGASAWLFFRQLRFQPAVCLLAALAAMLNTNSFSNVCWGLGTRALCLGAVFLALASFEASRRHRWPWLYLILGGLSLGVAVEEGADNGAIYSIFLAVYVAFSAWRQSGWRVQGAFLGIARVAVIAAFAALMAAESIGYLVPAAVKTVMHSQSTQQSKQADWDWATQWSLPPLETVRLLVPGIFGYRMDTPDGGQYWGTVGRQPGWDQHHQGFARQSGSGEYPGIIVLVIAAWAVGQSLRRSGSAMSDYERSMVRFCAVAALVCLILAFGRYAPVYRLVFALPYFSTIRNPIKFMHPFHLALLILFGYGLQDLFRRLLSRSTPVRSSMIDEVKAWWSKAPLFERRWIYGLCALFGASVLGFLLYTASSRGLVDYLTEPANTFSAAAARDIVGFSKAEIGFYLAFLAGAIAVFTLLVSGAFAARRVRAAGIIIGILLVVDLGRANAPWVKYQNYKQKYASNPVIDFLKEKPYEHRVTTRLMPMGQAYLANNPTMQYLFDEWMQHLFLFYNIQTIDIIQMPRVPDFDRAFMDKFRPASDADLTPASRLWQLTNTRFLLAMTGYLQLLNEKVDPVGQPFRVHSTYDIAAKPGISQPQTIEDITVAPKAGGPLALIEYTRALPRAALFTKWEVNTNDDSILARMAERGFDPAALVFVSETPSITGAPAATNRLGLVEFTGYAPKQIKLQANAEAPSILLLNDKYDADWKVYVDGAPAKLLRCNYIMRGVAVQPGSHRIEFRYEPALHGLYATLTGLALALILCCIVPFIPERKETAPAPVPPA